jgi:hypothetical protein
VRRRRRIAETSAIIMAIPFMIDIVIILPFRAGDASGSQPPRHGRVVVELLPELSDVDTEVAG